MYDDREGEYVFACAAHRRAVQSYEQLEQAAAAYALSQVFRAAFTSGRRAQGKAN